MQEDFTLVVKTKLLTNKIKAVAGKPQSIAGLARKLGKSRHVVSQAITHPIYPTIRVLIKKELRIK